MSPRHARTEERVEEPAPAAPVARGSHRSPERRRGERRRSERSPSFERRRGNGRRRADSGPSGRGRRRLVLGLATLLVLVGAGGALQYRHVSRSSSPPPAVSVATGRTQRTLLLQVRGVGGDAGQSALLASDPRSGQSALLLVPNGVVAEVPGHGTQPFGQVVGQPGGDALSRSTLADLVGVNVDASWVLDRAAFAALVDRLGGVTVDVDIDVVVNRNGSPVVLLPQGAGQPLTGAQAVDLMGYRAAGEDEVEALPRVQNVLVAVLEKVPAGAGPVSALASSLGAGSRLSDPQAGGAVLDGFRRDLGADRSSFQILPVLPIDGGGAASYRVDADRVAALSRGPLAGSRLAGHGSTGNRVLVLNQAGGAGLGQQIRDRIVPSGFAFVDSRNQTPFGRAKTMIVVFDRRPDTLARAARLAAALGLPHAPVQVSERGQTIADLIVIVGTDFRA